MGISIDKKNVSKRFYWIIAIVVVFGFLIIRKAAVTVFVEREGWLKKIAQLKVEDKRIEPNRGNIYSSNGELMASSIPQYYAHVDFKAKGIVKDTLLKYLPEISNILSQKFGGMSASGYRSNILRGYEKKTGYMLLIPRKISYTEMKDLKEMPYFKKGPNKSGLILTPMAQRKKPYGSLASRTIGDVYGDVSKGGKNGLELQYDSILTGIPGIGTRQKINGRYITTTEVEPTNGADITTTIDIDIQEITQTALLDELKLIDAESGTAIVMEVKTGAIKAITNLGRMSPGVYGETQNYAVADESEPGSTFKVVSMMIALDKGVVTPKDSVFCENGLYMYKGARMTDHNMHKGGYQYLRAEETIWNSSNIGVAKIILKGFENNPSEFVDAIYEMGINKDLKIGIPGAGRPKIRHPKDSTRYWSKTSLPWMSFGYETQIPPIYTLNFYNAIANDGKLMRPYFVNEISKDGKVIETMEPEVVNSKICKSSTLKEIREMLKGVVENGTAKVIKSDKIQLAGKTGTAQISKGAAGYTAGGKSHQISFCGYFPADNPKYSCIVVIRSPRNGYPSGGGMCGLVFKNIAERTFAQDRFLEIEKNQDSTACFIPYAKNGNFKDLSLVLDKLNIDYDDDVEGEWAQVKHTDKELLIKDLPMGQNLVPNVIGMGAKDAVFLLENCGLKAQITGVGKVYSQSRRGGERFNKGDRIVLNLK
ncbi:MAG: penicillin-binding transpeptidase domain-containing protein [Bacteroidales bacterium]|nr:penicillin-binding transpeptidase domain-containing protein [Bacteroidales bacterium]